MRGAIVTGRVVRRLSALGFEIDPQFVRTIDKAQHDRLFRDHMRAAEFDALVELYEGPMSSMFGDIRPDCIVVCIPDALGDLRVQNPELSAKERRALEILKSEEESLQGDLFAPTEEELAEAEALRTTAEDLLFRSFYRALKAKVHKYENAVPVQVLRRGTIDPPWKTPGTVKPHELGTLRRRYTTRPAACPGARRICPMGSASSGCRSIISRSAAVISSTPVWRRHSHRITNHSA